MQCVINKTNYKNKYPEEHLYTVVIIVGVNGL